MATAMRFFVLRGACASPSRWSGGLRCWRLASVALCCATAQQCNDALRWNCVTAAAMLMVAAGTTVDKSILVPFVALQAPSGVTFFVKEDHGRLMWIGLLIGIMRFLYIITGEWRRAISTTFLVAIAMVPSQVMKLRESQGRAVLSSAIAVYLAFQHFTGAGSLRKAFGSVAAIFATLCIVCMTTISLMLVF
ncbi:cold-regulated 413 inner membrane protein 1, chloroplastic [Sorghum bicolor]|uniref:Uncharacterized protein n=1 Tax=Sorghum bicolor TaxID=4558 RepID=A0A1B6Q560_SORBI|nr:cold-regulated 413 inner membrane protein 1, chloroplastic [Sorghum bicolor]KXG33053.1 hypothetical protein SORBI_3003G247700 [Sorghum bicolor]|eukprot:XP_021312896.1 cold-regulated 413 inner membrane protein 1, chloroplastic [Sorghum bicolor]